jgi:hypothetical protein
MGVNFYKYIGPLPLPLLLLLPLSFSLAKKIKEFQR